MATKKKLPLAKMAAAAKKLGYQTVPLFEVGQHCRRFWDPKADNDTACLICEEGVLVFTPHDKPFMSWRDIFGASLDKTTKSTVQRNPLTINIVGGVASGKSFAMRLIVKTLVDNGYRVECAEGGENPVKVPFMGGSGFEVTVKTVQVYARN